MQVRIWEKQYYLFFKHGHIAWLPAFKTCACVPKTWLFFLADKVIRPLYKSCLPDEKKKKKIKNKTWSTALRSLGLENFTN